MELTDELLKKAAVHITNSLFKLGDEFTRPTQRMQFIGGSILDGAETIQGGLSKRSMERVMSRFIAEAFTNKPKKIDMSVCIKSGVLMEFSDTKEFAKNAVVGKLLRVNGTNSYTTTRGNSALYCRPMFNHTHAHSNGWNRSPIPDGFVIRVFGKHISEEGHIFDNMSDINWSNITMFEITGIMGEYQL